MAGNLEMVYQSQVEKDIKNSWQACPGLSRSETRALTREACRGLSIRFPTQAFRLGGTQFAP